MTSIRFVLPAALVLAVAVAVTALVASGDEPAEAATQNFPITVGDTISNGVPSPGAGNIEGAGDEDVYTFTLAANSEVYFDSLSGSCALRWELTTPSAVEVFESPMCSDPGFKTLAAAGTYTLRVFAGDGTTTGTYSFRTHLSPAPQNFAIDIGDTVSNGVPLAGAGNIEAVGAKDIYTFTAAAGDEVYFESISGPCGARWELTSPMATEIFDSPVCSEPGYKTLAAAGTYTIRVFSADTTTGTYSFRTYLSPAPQNFAIDVGDTISNGVPLAGAGNIEAVGAKDVYTFTAAQDSVVYFDSISGACSIRWELITPSATEIFDSPVCSEPGFKTLVAAGTYTIRVSSPDTTTGTYSFRTFLAPAAQNFAIDTGDTVSDGVPSPGAGNIEAVGAQDVYTFTAAAGAEVYFEAISGACGIRWELTPPAGGEIFDSPVCSEPGYKTLAAAGTYTIRVYTTDTTTGPYSFRTHLSPAPQNFVITIGDTVSNGVPGTGAGNIEAVGARDIYTFEATPGQLVDFQSLSGACALRWVVTDSNDAEVFDSPICADPGAKTLTLGGTYTIEVSTTDPTTGTYSFSITSTTPPPATATPTNTATATSTPIATNTPTHTPTATHTFTPSATSTSTSTPTSTSTSTPSPIASTATPTATSTNTPVPTSTHTPTATNTASPTNTGTPVATSTHTPTSTNTPIPTSTNTPTVTPTGTVEPVDTATPTATSTETPVPTATNTPSPTSSPAANTATPTPSSTQTPVATSTNTPTATATTAVATTTPTATQTNTPVATSTNTATPTATSTASQTPTATSTQAASQTPTATPTQGGSCGNADVTGDGRVTARDVVAVALHLLKRQQHAEYDVNGDGRVDPRDLKIVITCMQEERRL